MSERNLDFDTPVERKGTDCLKYDFAVERGMSPDILPLWVADMDFRISSYIQDALTAQAAHGIYGYSDSKEDYFAAVRGLDEKEAWMAGRRKVAGQDTGCSICPCYGSESLHKRGRGCHDPAAGLLSLQQCDQRQWQEACQ